MRISDWSSDVCSSDLDHQVGDPANALLEHFVGHRERFLEGRVRVGDKEEILVGNDDQRVDMFLKLGDAGVGRAHTPRAFEHEGFGHDRSEEHTSELQSLMRISYAVFCLKKKKIRLIKNV